MSRDLPRVAEAHERPRLAAVGRLPDAVAVRDVAANADISPPPTYTTSGFEGATAIAPMVPPKYLSVTGAQDCRR